MTGNESAFIMVAFRPQPANTITSCPSAGQEFVIYQGGTGATSTPNPPGQGLGMPQATGCGTRTFTVTVPASLSPGSNYNLIATAGTWYVQCAGGQERTAYTPFTTSAPSSCYAQLLKRVEGTAEDNQLMIYWVDYDYYNDTNISIQDTIPACASIQEVSPQASGAPYINCGVNCVKWNVPNADGTASTPYRQRGSFWVLVRLGSGCLSPLCNVATSTSDCGPVSSNSVCQEMNKSNLQLTKRQVDASFNPITVVNGGDTVRYILEYQFSGSGLKCFDSMQSYTLNSTHQGPGNTIALTNPSGGTWYYGPGDTGDVPWKVISGDTPGEKILQFEGSSGQYRTLLYDCPAAALNGEDFCGGMVQADVRIDGNIVNGDTGVMIRQDSLNPGNSYMALLTVDPFPGNPGTGAGQFQIQKVRNNSPCWEGECPPGTASATCPANMGVVMPPALAPAFGVWYTIKVLEQPVGHFYAKYWKRGTPEPTAWIIDWQDTGTCNGPMLDCTDPIPTDSIKWRPGIAGQADKMSYDNFRVYSVNSLTGAQIWDTIPVGIDYQSASPAPNGLIPGCTNPPSDCGTNEGMIRWDFTNNNFGAVNGNLFEGTGSFTWIGVADCNEAATAVNRASLGASIPPLVNNSNTTSLDILGCNSPTITMTRTNTATPTATPTSTMTFSLTYTPTYTATRSHTPTATPSFTNSFTSTYTSTRSNTPTVTDTNTIGPSPTSTATPSATPTFSDTSTHTPSRTPTATRSDTPTITITPSETPTITVTVPYTSTNTPTVTPTFTATSTYSFTATRTDTRTSTASATQSVTWTDSPTLTATPTWTLTATQTATYSNTATLTVTPTFTPSATVTSTVTITWTFTVSPTITETPVPVPHQVRIGAYNSAGELVKLIFNGAAQYKPGDLSLSTDVIPGGAGGVQITFPGYLYDPVLGQLTGILWLADNNDGQLVGGGVYTIKAEVTDNFGQITTLQKSVQVISVVPQNEIIIFNSAGEIVARPQLPTPPSGRAYTSMSMKANSFAPEYDSTGSVVAGLEFDLTDETGAVTAVSWDGRNAFGVPVASGSYTAELIYSPQGPGSKGVVESRSFVVMQIKVLGSLEGAVLGPNPALNGQPIKIWYPVSPGFTVRARLFNLAGELVGQTEGSSSGLLTLSTAGAAPGVYLVQLESMSGGTVVNRLTMKAAIVR